MKLIKLMKLFIFYLKLIMKVKSGKFYVRKKCKY